MELAPFFFEIRPQNGVFYALSRLAWGESLHGTASEELLALKDPKVRDPTKVNTRTLFATLR